MQSKPKIYAGICEYCGIPAVDCIHHSQISKDQLIPLQPISVNWTSKTKKIPKIIYTTWISDKPLPKKFDKYIKTWSKVMPNYKIVILGLDNIEHNKFINDCLDRKMFCVAGHYARVQAIYNTGGIYFDIDVEAIKKFDDLLDNKMFVGLEEDNLINNAVFGSRIGHPFLKAQMEYLDSFDLNNSKVELETGIRAFTKMYGQQDWGDLITCYPKDYFYPYFYNQKFTKECITKDTYAIHHWAYSWNSEVSIIIPCYKQAHWLAEAIESALNQTEKPLEIIVVNDGSPDNTSEVAKRYQDQGVILIEQKNAGVSAARNAGIAIARGKYIATLDADDTLHPDFIKKTKGIDDITGTQLKTFGDNESIWSADHVHPTHEILIQNNQLNCCSLYKREIWEAVGGYDENMKLSYEDWDFWVRATKIGYTATVVMETLFNYRKHGQSMSTVSIEKDAEIRAYMANKYKGYEKQTKEKTNSQTKNKEKTI